MSLSHSILGLDWDTPSPSHSNRAFRASRLPHAHLSVAVHCLRMDVGGFKGESRDEKKDEVSVTASVTPLLKKSSPGSEIET